jgi:sugar phosphate isomerase/epimerase
MPYKVGVSAGWWSIAKDPALLGMAQKIMGWGATAGCQFIQVDLDTTAEFYEPELNQQVRRAKEKMGMQVGLHAEVGEMMALDSAEKRLWDQSHLRLCETVKHSAELGMIYVNLHLSNRPMLSFVEAQQRVVGYQFPVVSFDGTPLTTLTIDNPKTKSMAVTHMSDYIRRSPTVRESYQAIEKEKYKDFDKRVNDMMEQIKKEGKEVDISSIRNYVTGIIRKEIEDEVNNPDFTYNIWLKMKDDDYNRYLLEDGEFGAYHIVATYMKEISDSLWSNIAGNSDPERCYIDDEPLFSAAVASKYLEGHLKAKTKYNAEHLNGMSVLEWCEKHKLYLLFEIPEAHTGLEGLLRLYNPLHAYHFIKKIKSPYIKLCIDFEHMLSNKLDPDKIIKAMPNDAGSTILLFHLGKPIPYFGTAHIPIARGSRAQEIIYKWMFELRKKGFKDGYMIFERGSGRSGGGRSPLEVMEDSVTAIRLIAKYLEMDISPNALPADFYGISWENTPVFKRQQVIMRDHAWDPLEGVLMVPEEKHTFLGKSAVDKGKAQEWEKRKFR